MIKVKQAGHKGRGIFATEDIRKGKLIEKCPIIVISKKEWKYLEKTILKHYVFSWNKKGDVALALGTGSLYNHSFNPNIDVYRDPKNKTFSYYAIKRIKKGKELLIDYGYAPENYISTSE
jgi:SET domain-containing protein